MPIQKLILEPFVDDDYELIAIHCSLASYKLAFVLNKYLRLHLYRKKEDLLFQHRNITTCFPLYQYQDHSNYESYTLVPNVAKTLVNNETSLGLFSDQEQIHYLIPELKKVDYFLKIEVEPFQSCSQLISSKLHATPHIVTAYEVAHTSLKSKNNLIFE